LFKPLPDIKYIQKLVAPLSMCNALEVLAAPMKRLGHVVAAQVAFERQRLGTSFSLVSFKG
jgi:hypothetical protein